MKTNHISFLSFLLAVILSLNSVSSMAFAGTTGQSQHSQTAKKLFLKKQLRVLETEYSEWQFKALVVRRYAHISGMATFIDFWTPPVVMAASVGSFIYVWRVAWKSLSGGMGACGCFLPEFLGATLAGTLSGATAGVLVYQLNRWYHRSYSAYYLEIEKMDQAQIAEEWLTIQAAIVDLEDQITKTETKLRDLE